MNEKNGITSSAFIGTIGTVVGLGASALALPGLTDCVRMTALIAVGAVMVAYIIGNAIVKLRESK